MFISYCVFSLSIVDNTDSIMNVNKSQENSINIALVQGQ